MALYKFTRPGTVVDASGHRTVGNVDQVADFDADTAAAADDGLLEPADPAPAPAKKGKAAKAAE